MVQSYGVPEQAASVAALNTAINDNTRLLSKVATTALAPVTTAVGVNQAFLDRLRSTLRRSLASRVANGGRNLGEVESAVRSNLSAQAAVAQSALATAATTAATEPAWWVVVDPDSGVVFGQFGADYLARFSQKVGPFPDRSAVLDYLALLPADRGPGAVLPAPAPSPGPSPPAPPAPVPAPVSRRYGIYRDTSTGRFSLAEVPTTGQLLPGLELVESYDNRTQATLRLLTLQPREPGAGTAPPVVGPPPVIPAQPGMILPREWRGLDWGVVTDLEGNCRAGQMDALLLALTPQVIGPFASEADALAYIAAHPELPCQPAPPVTVPGGNGQVPPSTCPPLAPPPPIPDVPLPTIPPITECGLSATGALPAVGSPEFCACLQNLTDWAVELGQKAIAYLFGEDFEGQSTGPGFIDQVAAALLGLDNVTLIGSLKLGSRAQEIIDQVKPVLKLSMQAVLTAPTCNPLAQLGLGLARAVVRMLKNLRIGWTLGVQVTVDLDVLFPALDHVLIYVEAYICPTEIPSVPEALECLFRNTAPREQVKCWLGMRGVDIDVWEPVLRARRDTLTAAEWIEFVRRIGGPDVEIETQIAALRNVGWTDPQEAAARVELYDHLPTISDHLHWTLKNVFDRDYVEEFELLEGFADKFWPEFGADLRALGMKEKYAQLHYAAHWLNPAPEQLKEMVYRLRPDKVGAELGFTLAQYQKVLQEKDVGPFFQRRFAAIAYRVPALSYLRDMYRAGVISEEDLKGYHQDLGYSEVDSERFVGIDRVLKTRIRTQQAHGWTPAALASAYGVGAVERTFVLEQMAALGYQVQEAEALMRRAEAEVRRTVLLRAISRAITTALTQVSHAQKAGVLGSDDAAAAMVAIGFPVAKAAAIAQANQTETEVSLVRRATGRIRNAWMSGQIDEAFAQQALTQLRLTREFIAAQLVVWKVERTPNRRRRTALQYMDDWTNEELSAEEAHARLRNLGYEEEDIRLFFRAAARKAQKASERAARGAARTAIPATAPPAEQSGASLSPAR